MNENKRKIIYIKTCIGATGIRSDATQRNGTASCTQNAIPASAHMLMPETPFLTAAHTIQRPANLDSMPTLRSLCHHRKLKILKKMSTGARTRTQSHILARGRHR
jgi:cellulose biosynthesis protein BcsQ